jgi:hypothetical protein
LYSFDIQKNASLESDKELQDKQITKKIRKHKAGLLLQLKKITTRTWRHKENKRNTLGTATLLAKKIRSSGAIKKTSELGHEEDHGSRRPLKLLLWLLQDFCRWIPQSVCTNAHEKRSRHVGIILGIIHSALQECHHL